MNTIDSAVQTFSYSIGIQNLTFSDTTCIANTCLTLEKVKFQVGTKFSMHVLKIQINVITANEVELKKH